MHEWHKYDHVIHENGDLHFNSCLITMYFVSKLYPLYGYSCYHYGCLKYLLHLLVYFMYYLLVNQ